MKYVFIVLCGKGTQEEMCATTKEKKKASVGEAHDINAGLIYVAMRKTGSNSLHQQSIEGKIWNGIWHNV